MQQIGQEAPLRLGPRVPGAIDLRPNRFISIHKPLFRHDLEHLQNGRISSRLDLVQDVLDIPNGSWTLP